MDDSMEKEAADRLFSPKPRTKPSAGASLLCPCGNRAVGKKDGMPFCMNCVAGASPSEIMAKMPVIKDQKLIDCLKNAGRE